MSIRRKHPSRWVWLAALAGFSLGALLLVLAPGNAHRGAHFADKPGPLRLAFELLWASVRLPAKWSIRPMLLGATVLAVPVLSAALRPSAWARRITGWHVLLSAAASWFLVLGSLAPGYVSLGFGPPGRAVNVSYFIFLAGWFVTAGLAVAWRENVAAARHPAMVGPTVPMLSPRVRVCGWALLLGGLLAVGNFPWAVYDLAFVVGDYDRRLESRYAELDAAAARGQSSATVVPLTTRPRRTICQGDVGDDPSQTPFIARYFGLASLTVAGAEPQRR